MISTLFEIAKPVAEEARPAYEFSSEITTGMSAPPMGITIRHAQRRPGYDQPVKEKRTRRG